MAGPLGSGPVPTLVPRGPHLGQALTSPGPRPRITDRTPRDSKAPGAQWSHRVTLGNSLDGAGCPAGPSSSSLVRRGPARGPPAPPDQMLPPLPLLLGCIIAVPRDRLRREQGGFRQVMGGLGPRGPRKRVCPSHPDPKLLLGVLASKRPSSACGPGRAKLLFQEEETEKWAQPPPEAGLSSL